MTTSIKTGVSPLNESKAVQAILKVLRRSTGLRVVMIGEAGAKVGKVQAVLDDAGFGLKPSDDLDAASTYCQIVWKTKAPLLINHASRDERFSEHPGVKIAGVESYLGVPLIKRNGEVFGNLCAFDTLPANLSPENIELFDLCAQLIGYELETANEKTNLEKKVEDAQEITDIRTRFMSILGHDLRNPLNTIMMAANLQLKNKNADERSRDLSGKIIKSARRMQKMISDLLDTTRTENQITLPFVREHLDLCSLFSEITEEFRIAHSTRTIEFDGDERCEGKWDAGRIVQVYSNLLSNALHYGEPEMPVKVNIKDTGENVRVSVWSKGKVIPADETENIFQPFWRGTKDDSLNSSGLGLGLYIVQEIMQTHGGKIELESDKEKGTTFTAVFAR